MIDTIIIWKTFEQLLTNYNAFKYSIIIKENRTGNSKFLPLCLNVSRIVSPSRFTHKNNISMFRKCTRYTEKTYLNLRFLISISNPSTTDIKSTVRRPGPAQPVFLFCEGSKTWSKIQNLHWANFSWANLSCSKLQR